MKKKMKNTKMIAPRLANGDVRIGIGHGLPPDIKEGLKAIARKEKKSLSWVLEEVVIDYFDLRRPKYRKPAPEGAIVSLEELVEKAKELNDASDLLNQQIKAIDAALQKLNIGLVCWESVNDYLNIGYWNNGKRWGIAIYHRGHTAQKEAFWLFDEAPRAYRVKVIEYIPNLIEALIRVSNAMVLRLKQKADIANKFVEIMEEVNSERGKKNV